MAKGLTISDLVTASAPLDGTEVVEIEQSGNSRKLTISALITGTNVALKNAANTFTATQTVAVADGTAGLILASGTGQLRAYGYVDTVGTYIEGRNGAGSALGPLTIDATTLALGGTTSITLNGVNVTDYARKSQANTYTDTQRISMADGSLQLDLRGATGKLLLYGRSGGGSAYLQSTNIAGTEYEPLSIEASTLALVGDTFITLNGVNATDFARKSQANTFTAAQTIQAASASLTFDATADLRVGADATTTFVQAQTNHPLDFYTNNALRFRLGSDGNFDFQSGKLKVNLSNFADDSAAASGGIAVGELYRNGSVVQVRVS